MSHKEERRWYKWFYDQLHSHYYDLLMKWCWLPLGGEAKCREELVSSIDFSPDGRILDMCCGTGTATFAIARRAGKRNKIIGMDLSSGQIRIAKRKNRYDNIEFTEGDAAGTGFTEGEFDKVFITHALHEMPRQSRFRVLVEAQRILKDKGELVVLELDRPENVFVRLFLGFWFLYWLPFNFETTTRRDMLKHGLCGEVREAGFGNVRKVSLRRGVLQIVKGEKRRPLGAFSLAKT